MAVPIQKMVVLVDLVEGQQIGLPQTGRENLSIIKEIGEPGDLVPRILVAVVVELEQLVVMIKAILSEMVVLED